MALKRSVLMPTAILAGLAFFQGSSGRVTPGSAETLKDFEGNEYKTIQIGDKVWMAENLRSTRTPKGVPVTSFSPNEIRLNGRSLADFGWKLPPIAPKGRHLHQMNGMLLKNAYETPGEAKDTIL
jgi:hypothetical protein